MDTARKILTAQLAVSVALAAAAWLWQGYPAARSVFLGGAICFLPNAFLALRLFASRNGKDARDLMRAAWFGELGKLALTATGFALVFTQVRPLQAGLLFAGFIAAQAVVLLALAVPGAAVMTRETNG